MVTARRTPGKNGSRYGLPVANQYAMGTARRTPGKNGSRVRCQRIDVGGGVTARRTPGKNGSAEADVMACCLAMSQPGERRARMEARAICAAARTGSRSQPGERRARMEATSNRTPSASRSAVTARRTPGKNGSQVLREAGVGDIGRHSPANGQEWKRRARTWTRRRLPASQPGERRARMEAARRRACTSGPSASQPGERRARMEA